MICYSIISCISRLLLKLDSLSSLGIFTFLAFVIPPNNAARFIGAFAYGGLSPATGACGFGNRPAPNPSKFIGFDPAYPSKLSVGFA